MNVHQSARDAAADLAYHHTGQSGGPPNWFVPKRPEPKPPRRLPYTLVDAARTIGMDTDRDPGTWDSVMERKEWAEQAACKGQTSFFFPDVKGPIHGQLRVCAGCPVRLECLTFAINNYERFGVWGGVSGEQRGEIRGRVHRGEAARLLATPLRPTVDRRRKAS